MRKQLLFVLVAAAMILAACQGISEEKANEIAANAVSTALAQQVADEPTAQPTTVPPTAAPTAEPTVAQPVVPAPTTGSSSSASTSVLVIAEEVSYQADGVAIYGVPETAHPVRWAGVVQTDQECTIPMSCWILGSQGVLSADNQAEAVANLSAVWTGGANVDNLMENRTGTYILPEAGYVKVTFPQMTVTGVNPETGQVITLTFEAVADRNYTFLVRGMYDGAGDRNIVLDFTTEHPGRVKVMRYPVLAEHSGFYSEAHLLEDLMAGHSHDNCGATGCTDSIVVLLDYNDGSFAVYRHTVAGGMVLLATNVVQPNP